jgi:osmotically inducible protein OsmC
MLNKIPYSWNRHANGKASSPPELIAAAHAGSFSMSLASELGDAGFSPEKIDTTATVTMESRPAGWRLTQIHLDVVATVARVVECDFVDAALRAKASCPISQLVSANISMRAKLNRRCGAERLFAHHESTTLPVVIIHKKLAAPTAAKPKRRSSISSTSSRNL